MDRDIPAYNPIIVGKMQQKNLQKHYQRLQSIKSHHSRLHPSQSLHSRNNPKAIQRLQDKQTQIQKDNILLFNKMKQIMKRNDPCNQPILVNVNRNSRPSGNISRIQEQNRTMYQRLEKQKPTIDNRKLQEERKKQENILKFLGKYSAHSLQNTQTNTGRQSQSDKFSVNARATRTSHYLQKPDSRAMQLRYKPRYLNSSQFDQQIDQDEFRAHVGSHIDRKKVYSSTFEAIAPQNRRQTQQNRQSQMAGVVFRKENKVPSSAKDIILYKCQHNLQGQSYDISIVRSHMAYQIRVSGHGQEMKIQLSQIEGNDLLDQVNYDYKAIVGRICLQGTKLLLAGQPIMKEPQVQEDEETEDMTGVQAFKRRPLMHHFNPSHISEQNQEESFRPNESVHHPPLLYEGKRQDSLGPQEFIQSFPEEDLSEKQTQQKHETPQEYEKKGEEVGVEPKEPQEGKIGFEMGTYEQALQQQLI